MLGLLHHQCLPEDSLEGEQIKLIINLILSPLAIYGV